MVGFDLLVFHHPHFQLLVWRGLVDHQMAFGGSLPDPSEWIEPHFSKAGVGFKANLPSEEWAQK
jgi:hypothetical protein